MKPSGSQIREAWDLLNGEYDLTDTMAVLTREDGRIVCRHYDADGNPVPEADRINDTIISAFNEGG